MKRSLLVLALFVIPSALALIFLPSRNPQPEPPAQAEVVAPPPAGPASQPLEPAPEPREKLLPIAFDQPSRAQKLAALNALRRDAALSLRGHVMPYFPDTEEGNKQLKVLQVELEWRVPPLTYLDPIDELLIDAQAHSALVYTQQADALIGLWNGRWHWERAQVFMAKAAKEYGGHPLIVLKNADLAMKANQMELASSMLERIDGWFSAVRIWTPKVYYERRATTRVWIKNIQGAIDDLKVVARMTEAKPERDELEQRIVELQKLQNLQK